MKRLVKYIKPIFTTILCGSLVGGTIYLPKFIDRYLDKGQGRIESFAFDDNRDGVVSEEEMRKYHPHFRQDSENNLENNIVYNQTEN